MAHIHEKIDFTADVAIVNGNTVLLRMHDKLHKWLMPGGHIELDEDPVEAARREVKEETGLDVEILGASTALSDGSRDLPIPAFMNRHHITEEHEHISLVYIARSATRDVVDPDTHEKSGGMRWITRDELDDPELVMPENIRHYAKAALDAIS